MELEVEKMKHESGFVKGEEEREQKI